MREKARDWREQLLEYRQRRIHPYKDDKILTAWNGLMIAALAKGSQVLDKPEYARAAERAAQFILSKMRRSDGRLLARFRHQAAIPAFLDDYAFLAWGLLELYQATFRDTHLEKAAELTREMLRLFADPAEGGFFFSGADSEKILGRPKTLYDGAMPSGNSVAAWNLAHLARITGDNSWLTECERLFSAFAETINRHPTAHTFALMAWNFLLSPPQEIVIAGRPDLLETKQALRQIVSSFLPNAVILFNPTGPRARELGISEELGQPKVFICENFACQQPITDGEALSRYLQHQQP